MATGTGKTKTCIALVYRFLKAQRFRRILFLVDRTALGEQAANAFHETRMESLRTFAEIFGIKEIDEQRPDRDTSVHIATVQGMVQRLQYAPEDSPPPAVDAYDCIVVDECHRGYLLDRQLSDAELTFRGFDDYVSKYRKVVDYFDAVKIGLTATPALHTVQIFGMPAAGSMTVDETSNGPVFKFPMQGERSKGIKNMQIFCFDMMLMRLCARRRMGPGFLIHDSHLFDGVDGRQVISALRLGSEIAQELGFQYIVTLNEDDAFKETIEGFDLNDYVLHTRLTDATDDGGLFGIRFG